jgi:hypothetical protein
LFCIDKAVIVVVLSAELKFIIVALQKAYFFLKPIKYPPPHPCSHVSTCSFVEKKAL